MNKWIEWKGGECPVPEGTVVNIKLRDVPDKENTFNFKAEKLRWNHTNN